MARYIDIDKAIDVLLMTEDFCFCPRDKKEYEETDCGKYTRIGGCPECWIQHNAEDVIPVVHAKWESELANNGWKDISCSNCNYTINTGIPARVDVHCSVDYNYCPNCGATMDKI